MVAVEGIEPVPPLSADCAEAPQEVGKPPQNQTLAPTAQQAPEQKPALSEHAEDTSAPPSNARFMPEDLAQVVEAWDRLPAAVRAGILAMVDASKNVH